MLAQLAIGCCMILATTVVHGFATLVGTRILRRHYARLSRRRSDLHDTMAIALYVLWLFLATVTEVWMWAGLYSFLGVLGSLEEALYFSTVTFSTLGYGDIVLGPSWRLLAAFQAANGLFLFGWSTALVFLVVERLYEVRTGDKR
jgi:hypothetical protein